MKKKLLIVMALVVCLSLSLAGCGEEPTVVENGQKVTVENEYEFTIDSWDHGDQIEGNYSANSSYSFTPLDHVAYIEMEYKNLSSETLSSNDAFGGSEMDGELIVDGTSYPIDTYVPDDILALSEGPVYICYTVPADVIENGTEKVATFRLGEVLYQYVLEDEQVQVVSSDAVEIKVGDVITSEGEYEFTVKGVSSGSELSDGGGSITYSYSPSDYMMWIELSFKNLGTSALEEWDCPLFEGKYELLYDGKYEYVGGAWFAEDIPALGSANVFVYFEVSQDVSNGSGEKVATFNIGDEDYLFCF